MNDQPQWFQTLTSLPIIGPLAGRLGPWGCGGCLAVGLLAFCLGTLLIVAALTFTGDALSAFLRARVIDPAFYERMVLTNEAVTEVPAAGPPTLTPAPQLTAIATPTPSTTAEAGEAPCQATAEDPPGDVSNPETGEVVEAVLPDIVEVSSYCDGDVLVLEVVLRSADVTAFEYYSFAAELFLLNQQGQQLYSLLYQYHAGELTKEIRDFRSVQSRQVDEEIEAVSSGGLTVIRYRLPLADLANEGELEIFAQSFFMEAADGVRVSDELDGTLMVPPLPSEGS